MLTARQEMDRVLAGLGALVGAPLRLDEDGVVALEFEDDIVATIEVPEGIDRIFVQLTIGRLPREGREAVLAAALGLNRFGLDMADAWLATDAAGEELLLCHTLPAAPADMDNFPETLAALIAEVGNRRSLLQAGRVDPADAAPAEQSSTLFFRG